jgi:hypothetical protein
MLAKIYYPILLLIIFSCFPVYSQEVKTIMSDNPKYSDKEKFIDFTFRGYSQDKGEYPIEKYNRETFISVDYTFNNEGLNKPYKIREVPNSHEIIVLDVGNICFYVFTEQGKFIRKIGSKGQGPGELLGPMYFDVDDDGDIYVFDNRNSCISIFKKTGEFVSSFRVGVSVKPNLFVTKEKNILLNLPSTGYFITVYSRKGDVLERIGTIPSSLNNPSYAMGLSGWTIKANNNYYVFLESLKLVYIYNIDGSIKQKIEFKDIFPYMKSAGEYKGEILLAFYDIIYRKDKFYIFSIGDETKAKAPDMKNLRVFVINSDLKIIKKIILPLADELEMPKLTYLRLPGSNIGSMMMPLYSIEVLINENILFPHKVNGEVCLFKK